MGRYAELNHSFIDFISFCCDCSTVFYFLSVSKLVSEPTRDFTQMPKDKKWSQESSITWV